MGKPRHLYFHPRDGRVEEPRLGGEWGKGTSKAVGCSQRILGDVQNLRIVYLAPK